MEGKMKYNLVKCCLICPRFYYYYYYYYYYITLNESERQRKNYFLRKSFENICNFFTLKIPSFVKKHLKD